MQQETSRYPSKLPMYRQRQTDSVLEREKIFLEQTCLSFWRSWFKTPKLAVLSFVMVFFKTSWQIQRPKLKLRKTTSCHISSSSFPINDAVNTRCILWVNYSILFWRSADRASQYIIISVFNQLDAQNLFHNKFYFMPLHVSSTCAHHQEFKIALHSLWYHHTYVEAWNKLIVKPKFCPSSWLVTEINTVSL